MKRFYNIPSLNLVHISIGLKAIALIALLIIGGSAQAQNTHIWTGAVNNDWGTAGNWDVNSVPGVDDDVVVTSDGSFPIIAVGESVTVANLTISSGSFMRVGDYSDGPASLTVTGNLVNDGDNIQLQNSSNLLLMGAYSGTGVVALGRTAYGNSNYNIVGVPLINETIGVLNSDFGFTYNNSSQEFIAINSSDDMGNR